MSVVNTFTPKTTPSGRILLQPLKQRACFHAETGWQKIENSMVSKVRCRQTQQTPDFRRKSPPPPFQPQVQNHPPARGGKGARSQSCIPRLPGTIADFSQSKPPMGLPFLG